MQNHMPHENSLIRKSIIQQCVENILQGKTCLLLFIYFHSLRYYVDILLCPLYQL